jgi:hypothetical protein
MNVQPAAVSSQFINFNTAPISTAGVRENTVKVML